MAREKKPIHKVQMTEGKRNIIQMLLQEYDVESAQDIQDALKDLPKGTIKEMIEADMINPAISMYPLMKWKQKNSKNCVTKMMRMMNLTGRIIKVINLIFREYPKVCINLQIGKSILQVLTCQY